MSSTSDVKKKKKNQTALNFFREEDVEYLRKRKAGSRSVARSLSVSEFGEASPIIIGHHGRLPHESNLP